MAPTCTRPISSSNANRRVIGSLRALTGRTTSARAGREFDQLLHDCVLKQLLRSGGMYESRLRSIRSRKVSVIHPTCRSLRGDSSVGS